MTLYIENQPDYFDFKTKNIIDFKTKLIQIEQLGKGKFLTNDFRIIGYFGRLFQAIKLILGFQDSASIYLTSYSTLKLLYFGSSQGYLEDKEVRAIVQRIYQKNLNAKLLPVVSGAFAMLAKGHNSISASYNLRHHLITFYNSNKNNLKPCLWHRLFFAPLLLKRNVYFGSTHLNLALQSSKDPSKQDETFHHFEMAAIAGEPDLKYLSSLRNSFHTWKKSNHLEFNIKTGSILEKLGSLGIQLLMNSQAFFSEIRFTYQEVIKDLEESLLCYPNANQVFQISQKLELLNADLAEKALAAKYNGDAIRYLTQAIKFGQACQSNKLKVYEEKKALALAKNGEFDSLKLVNLLQPIRDKIFDTAIQMGKAEWVISLHQQHPEWVPKIALAISHIQLGKNAFPSQSSLLGYLRTPYYKKTLEHFEIAFNNWDNLLLEDVDWLQKFVHAYEGSKQFEKAAQLVVHLKKLAPDNNFKMADRTEAILKKSPHFYEMGLKAVEEKNYEGALACFLSHIERGGAVEKPFIEKFAEATLLLKQNKAKICVEYLDKALKIHPYISLWHYLKAEILANDPSLSKLEAIKAYSAAYQFCLSNEEGLWVDAQWDEKNYQPEKEFSYYKEFVLNHLKQRFPLKLLT